MSDHAASPDPLSELARATLGVPYLYPIQRFVISNTLENKPQIVVLPTGAGKSLCFQLPSLLLPGATLVLLPLLSLLADQQRKLASAGMKVGILRGGLTHEEKALLFSTLRSGAVKIILATPEACLAEPNLAELRRASFSHFVVDEAHCVSEWGDTFRPAYSQVGRIARELRISMRTAFTATASTAVIVRIRELVFDDGEVRVITAAPDRPNIFYSVAPILSLHHSLEQLVKSAERPLLVFFRTRGGAELAARTLRVRCGDTRILFYHAGLSREERTAAEKWFLGSTDGVLLATCAYGLGVDKPNIRTVAHAQVPSTVEAYLQESGRAGRDGNPSRAILFVSREDRIPARTEDQGMSRLRYEGMLRYALSRDTCRRQALLSLIGQEPVACSGCDVCDGSAMASAEGRQEITGFFTRHKRRFTPSQAAAALCAAGGPDALRGFYDCLPGAGTLRSWRAEDVQEAILGLVEDGALAVARRGPWKKKVRISNKARPPRANPEARS